MHQRTAKFILRGYWERSSHRGYSRAGVRTHHGYRLKGRTPAQALMEALGVIEIPEVIPTQEEVAAPLVTAA